MAKLIYSMLCSVDGYIEDRDGKFDWAVPDAEVHSFANELTRPIGTHLYGRRMYEVMSVWEKLYERSDIDRAEQEFAAVWHDSDKIVFSRTLSSVSTARTELRPEFDPAEVRRLKTSATADISISGPDLAASAIAAGLVDDIHLLVVPAVVGGGKPVLPTEQLLRLELIEQRRFANGTVYLHYRPTLST